MKWKISDSAVKKRVAILVSQQEHYLYDLLARWRKSLCALINGDQGWLMYLREEGDSGFSSRNPDYIGPEDATVEYCLSNGQHDLYPASWTAYIGSSASLRLFRT